MKKCMFTLSVLTVSFSLISCDKEDTLIGFEKLPFTAQSFIDTHFDAERLIAVSCDKDFRDKEYKATFSDGTFISFDKQGHWDEIFAPQGVPQKIIPTGISEFVLNKHADSEIVGLDKNKKSIETELNNGLELKFDLNYNFVGYTD